MDTQTLIKNAPSVDLALFAVNTIYHPNEEIDWIHIKFLPFLNYDKTLKFLLKVSNPSFDQLPPVKIQIILQPLKFNRRNKGKVKAFSSNICEYLIVESLPENEEVEYEVFSNSIHSALLSIPCLLTINCFPYFNSIDDNHDWHSSPLYKTVLTPLDLLLNDKEITAFHGNSKIIPLTNALEPAEIEITAVEAMKLVSKEMKDIKEMDILKALFHYKFIKLEKVVSGFVFMDGSLIQVEVTVKPFVPRKQLYVFKILITTDSSVKNVYAMLFYQLQKKLTVLVELDSFPVQRPTYPSTIIWKPKETETQNFDFTFVEE